MLARPRQILGVADFEQQIEFLVEQRIVIAKVEAEKRERFGKRAAPDDQFGAPARNQIERGIRLEDPHRIGGAQNRDRARQANVFGARRARRQNDRRRRIEIFAAMMFANAKNIQARRIRAFDAFEQIVERTLRIAPVSLFVGRNRRKTVDANFHFELPF